MKPTRTLVTLLGCGALACVPAFAESSEPGNAQAHPKNASAEPGVRHPPETRPPQNKHEIQIAKPSAARQEPSRIGVPGGRTSAMDEFRGLSHNAGPQVDRRPLEVKRGQSSSIVQNRPEATPKGHFPSAIDGSRVSPQVKNTGALSGTGFKHKP
jgi:hypothetical protein